MSLPEGDYLQLEAGVVETIMADTGPGGLRESGREAVATVTAADENRLRALGQYDFPAILVRATAKKEAPAAPVYSLLKTFTLTLLLAHRAPDRSQVDDTVRRLAARLEQLLREQTAVDRQFLGLPDRIEGSEGVLVCALRETEFLETTAGPEGALGRGRITAEIMVPCSYRYE